ncbi:MAG: restriction modification system DNA specificity domain protein, nonfunctional [Candidatus Roizmanbacteria bacterium GW2011_GWA2_35_19]|uniref:Restriction modification system DNA specificity domain protein, nonfunctional n=1 Tax=Candidatus Roizmanbacteria bacterium GW2011_GWA2_35_19 TaxID=1618478 RepID=A0A0G0C736_9BACT|nr:MAG: restriction modification system DNA specificity domain protein, nonfunctional [Candidatus Roizmanbacteria bacterium GW2011_GWA2_35_19]
MKTNWQTKKLGEICEIVKDSVPEYVGEKKYFSTGSINNDKFYLPEKITYKEKPSRANSYPKAGDVGFAKMKFTNKVLMIDQDLSGSIFSTGFCFLRPNKLIDSRFLFHFVISDKFQKLKNLYAGDGIMGGIKNSDVKEIEMPFLPLSTQHRIVKKIDMLFGELAKTKENTEKNLQNTKDLFESYLQNIFTHSGKGWEQKKLGEVAVFRNGMNFTKGSKGEVIKIVGVKDFQKSFWIPFENLKSVTIDGKLNKIDFLKQGDILAVRSNGNPELIGRTLIAGNVIGKFSHSGFTIRIRLNSEDIYPIYLCHYLKSQIAKKQLIESGTGINIKSLNQVALSSLVIPLPPLSNQKSIVKKLDLLSEKTKKLGEIYKQKLADLKELKKSILKKAFDGEL